MHGFYVSCRRFCVGLYAWIGFACGALIWLVEVKLRRKVINTGFFQFTSKLFFFFLKCLCLSKEFMEELFVWFCVKSWSNWKQAVKEIDVYLRSSTLSISFQSLWNSILYFFFVVKSNTLAFTSPEAENVLILLAEIVRIIQNCSCFLLLPQPSWVRIDLLAVAEGAS